MSQLADMSVISFLKIIAGIKRSRQLIKYKDNKALCERIPNFEVRMGFGMHVGWAIEGAIGSIYKIDASYLSPNVNMASRLEAATKQFGVEVLISGEMWEILSLQAQQHFRQIDRVTVKGSVEPLGKSTTTSKLSIRSLHLRPEHSRTASRRDLATEDQERGKACARERTPRERPLQTNVFHESAPSFAQV